jgi:type VI secretion system secreted protein VgrG
MTATFTQAGRSLEIQTPLGENVIGLRSMVVREQLGRPFLIVAELSSADPDIPLNGLIGQPVVVRLSLLDGSARYFHAVVSRFSYVGSGPVYAHYRAELVPWLWILTRSSDCRIFQGLSAPEVLQHVLRDRGGKAYESRLSESHPALEYCVQYRETDFNFVSRLLEQEGIAYFFRHDEEAGSLVLVDAMESFEAAPGCAELDFREVGGAEPQKEVITRWMAERELPTSAYATNDYNPLSPRTDLHSPLANAQEHAFNDREVYDPPGEYGERSEGERLARLRLEELQTPGEVVRAETSCFRLGAGHVFSLRGHPRADQNRKYLVTALDLSWDAGEFHSEPRGAPVSSCQFTAIPASQAFRPARTTPKPLIQGPQPALVVGPPGEEIHTDEHGRVKVHFFWDRAAPADDQATCWIRVAQPWAGRKWGAITLPRIGQEVLVSFLEGDPDRPIILGSVYNAENQPPYELPANKTVSTLKSRSSPGGGGFNEIRFEDKKGSEQIFVHGEKNQDIRIKNDVYEWVGNDRHLVVKNNQLEHVESSRDEVVDADHRERIGKDRHLKVEGKEAKAVGGSLSLTVEGDVIEAFRSDHSESTTGDTYIKAGNVIIESTGNITLKVGGSFIAIEATGITISAPKVEIEGTASFEAKSPMSQVLGDATLVLKGGTVMIN